MRKRTILRSVLAVALLIVLAGQVVSVPTGWLIPRAHAADHGTVSPTFGPVGTTITLSGSATFPGATTFTADWKPATGPIIAAFATGAVDANGSFSVNKQIPAAPRGGASISITSNAPGSPVYNIPFTVTPQITVQPVSSPGGSTVIVTGTGFAANQNITFEVGSQPAQQVGNPVVSDNTGGFSATVQVPANAPSGPTVVGASDNAGSTFTTVLFTVGPVPSPTGSATATATTTATPTVTGTQTTGLTITPNQQTPGKNVTVSAIAGSFTAGTSVTVFFNDPTASNPVVTLSSSGVAASDGSFSQAVTLPAQATNGRATITAIGGGKVLSGVLAILAVVAATPTSVAVGSTVTVTGDGFGPNKTIGFAVNSTNVIPSSTVTTNALGHFSGTITIPTGVPAGTASITATDGTNTGAAVTQITITSTTTTPSTTVTQTTTPTVTGTPPTATPTATATSTSTTGTVTSAYFAEGYTGQAVTNLKATFSEVLNILNPNPSPATVTITYYIQGQTTPLAVNRTVAGSSMLRESVNADVGFDKFVAVGVTSGQKVSVTRTITRISTAGARLDGSTTQPVSAPAVTWGFPEGYTGITFQEYLTLLNPSNSQANVTIVLAPQAGSAAGARTLNLVVPPLGRATANIRGLNLGNSAKSVGMIITSNVPIVAERVQYFGDGAGSGKFGSTVSQGIANPASQLRIAYANSGGSAPDAKGTPQPVGDQDYITLLNPNPASGPVQVTVSFNDSAGHGIGQPVVVTVAGGTRQTVIANTALGSSAVGPFSISISASGPIEAESAQYYGGSPNTGLHPGVAFPALSGATTDAYLSELSNQLADGTSVKRTVYLYNPGSGPIQVSATYFGATGPSSQAVYTVPAGGIATVSVNQDTAASIPTGAIGAEFKLANGSTGSFIAYAVGITVDGLSATEDVGAAA